jgi:nitronate monooxygenase
MKRQISHSGRIQNWDRVIKAKDFTPERYQSGVHVKAMGADLAYIGTRFIAARESMASPAYRDMLIAADETDIVISDKFTGVPANYLQPSIAAAGIDLDAMQKRQGISIDQRDDAKAWRDIWSAGHGVRSTAQVDTVADLVERLTREYRDARVRSASASA